MFSQFLTYIFVVTRGICRSSADLFRSMWGRQIGKGCICLRFRRRDPSVWLFSWVFIAQCLKVSRHCISNFPDPWSLQMIVFNLNDWLQRFTIRLVLFPNPFCSRDFLHKVIIKVWAFNTTIRFFQTYSTNTSLIWKGLSCKDTILASPSA